MNSEALKGIVQELGNHSHVPPQERFVQDRSELKLIVEKLRTIGVKIVLTQGTFDLFHVGHARYLREARKHGDMLIVGVDDDEKARERKGENRPVVPLVERVEILTQSRSVDVVTVKRNNDTKWQLIKEVHPDVLIAVEGTYLETEIASLCEFCGEVVVLPRQAETSTSAKVRKLVLDGADMISQKLSAELPDRVAEMLREVIPGAIESVYHEVKGGKQ